jgi:hypothetical protein
MGTALTAVKALNSDVICNVTFCTTKWGTVTDEILPKEIERNYALLTETM